VTNNLTMELTPDKRKKQTQLGEYEDLSSYDTLTKDLTIEVNRYGSPGQAIHVAPDGDGGGDGTPGNPLDLHTAVAFAQPGQQVVLADGTYKPTRKIEIARGNDGTKDKPITLMSEPNSRATLDLSESSSGGITLAGDYWHLYNLEITKSQGNKKPLLIEGSHNVVERVETHHNGDTGLQISLSPTATHASRDLWPSDNLVLSSVSHNNADPLKNDADGFAAKLTVGEGNVFRYCVAHNNIDDGWDLYAKSTTGSIGDVVIEDSVAYHNGWLESDPGTFGEGNGFKLGGESMPGKHLLKNSVSFGNHAKGITSNSGPDVRIRDVTSYKNGDSNLYLSTSAESTDYVATGVLSYLGGRADNVGLRGQADTITTDPSNHLDGAGVQGNWFRSLDTGVAPEIADDGGIDMHGLLELTGQAPGDTGARFVANPSPTSITLLPAVSGR
jgi:pectate disaccharide-lyase